MMDSLTSDTRKQVLIVEDEEGIRMSLVLALETRGFKVDDDGSAETALARLVRDGVAPPPYDLVLVDRQLPKMDGIELIRRARHILPEAAFVLMTAYGTVESSIRAMELGACGYLLKPFDDVFAVASEVEGLLEEHRRRLERAKQSEPDLTQVTAKLREMSDALDSPTPAPSPGTRVVCLLRRPVDRAAVEQALGSGGVKVEVVVTLTALRERIAEGPEPSVVVFDSQSDAETRLITAVVRARSLACVAIVDVLSIPLTHELMRVERAGWIVRPLRVDSLRDVVRRTSGLPI